MPRRRPGSGTRGRAAWAPVVGVLVLLAIWARPSSLGGDTTYVVVHGSSMEPTYRDGDFVVLRDPGSYEVGDIVAYPADNGSDGVTLLIHRIVERRADRLVTQGDNRDDADPFRPTDDDLLGAAALRVPFVGGIGEFVAQPPLLAALAAIGAYSGVVVRRRRRRHVAALLLGTAMTHEPDPEPRGGPDDGADEVEVAPATTRGLRSPARATRVRGAHVRRRRRPHVNLLDRREQALRFLEPRWAVGGLVGCMLLAGLAAPVAWAAWHDQGLRFEPTTTSSADHDLAIDYVAVADPSDAYPDGSVGTVVGPDGKRVAERPLYQLLVQRIDVTVSAEVAEIAGTAGTTGALTGSLEVAARVETPEGWSDVLEIIGPTTVDEGSRTVELSIVPLEIAGRVERINRLTEVGRGLHTITVDATLTLTDGAGDRPQVVESRAAFEVAGGILTPTPVAPVKGVSTFSELRPVDENLVVLGAEFDPGIARPMFTFLFLLGLVGALGFVFVLGRGHGLDPAAQIEARYGSMIVGVTSIGPAAGAVAMVPSIDELARLAQREDAMILHEQLDDGSHRYVLPLGIVTYEFQTVPEHAGGAWRTSELDR